MSYLSKRLLSSVHPFCLPPADSLTAALNYHKQVVTMGQASWSNAYFAIQIILMYENFMALHSYEHVMERLEWPQDPHLASWQGAGPGDMIADIYECTNRTRCLALPKYVLTSHPYLTPTAVSLNM